MHREGDIILDLLITNGRVYDGKNNEEFFGNIGVKGKIIEYIGKDFPESKETICANNLVVSPGFVDIHSHTDQTFICNSSSESKILQGVTSELTGQCGNTLFPFLDKTKNEFMEYIGSDKFYDKQSYASRNLEEFLDKIQVNNIKFTTNQMLLVGHGALRTGVMGIEGREASFGELEKMSQKLDMDMKAGAWGMSLGLGYAPGAFATQRELNKLGQVIEKYDGLITSHMRNQAEKIYESLDEMFEIHESSGCRIHIAHLKMGGKKNWGTANKLYSYIEEATNRGIKVTKDMYPYTHSASGITNILPKWSLKEGIEKASELLIGRTRKEIIDFLDKRFVSQRDGEGVYIVSTHGRFPEIDGKNVWQLSQDWNVSMAEAAARIIIETKGHASGIFESMSEEDVLFLLSKDDISIGSDGSTYKLDPKKNEGKPHPRNFATFPRFFRLVREHNLCDLKTAIYRTTGLSAKTIGLKDRGVLEKGKVADITIFNFDQISDYATYENPFLPSKGIEHVIVNGKIAVNEGKIVNTGMGEIILKE